MESARRKRGGMPRPEHGSRTREVMPATLILAVMFTLLAVPAANIWTMLLIVLGVALTWVAPAVMISLVVVTVPIQESVMLPYFRGDLTLTQIAVFGLVIGWGLTFWRFRMWLDSVTMGYVAIGAAFLISLIATDDFGLWAGEVYRWVVAGLFFVICRSVLRDWYAIRTVLWGVVATTLATWCFSFGQAIAANGPEHMMRGGFLRVFGAFGTPNPLAAYVEFTIPILIVLAVLGFRRSFQDLISTPFWIASCLSASFGLVTLSLTQSRGGIIGFSFAMLVVLWALPFRLRLATVIAGLGIVLVVLLTPLGQSQLNRFDTVFTEPGESRTGAIHDFGFDRASVWIAAIRMFEDSPWTGVGAGEFDYHYRDYTPVWYERFPLGQAHDGWLQMAAQAGVAGVVAFTGWGVATLLSLIGAARRSREPLSRALAIGALAVMAAFTMHNLVDYLNVLSLGLQLSAVIAIGLNLAPEPLAVYSRSRPDGVPDAVADPLHTGLA